MTELQAKFESERKDIEFKLPGREKERQVAGNTMRRCIIRSLAAGSFLPIALSLNRYWPALLQIKF